MQQQINRQDTENKTVRTTSTTSPGSWSQLFNRYRRMVHMKRETENFIKNVFGPVLIAMLPVTIPYALSFTSIGINVYTVLFSLGVALFLTAKTNYKQTSFMTMHVGALYILLPTLFLVFRPLFYAITAIMTIVYLIER